MQQIVLTLHIPSTAADTEDQWYIPIPMPGRWRIDEAWFAPATAAAAHASNYIDLDLSTNKTADPTTFTAFASTLTTDSDTSVGMVLGTSREFTLTNTAAREVVQGEQIKLAKADPGTGAVLDGTLALLLTKIG